MQIDRLYRGVTPRVALLGTVIFLFLGGLIVRLWFEQVRGGEAHRQAIARQSIRRIRVAPIRGRILSRDGTPLNDNVPAFDVLFHLHEMRRPGRRRQTLAFVMEQIQRTADLLGVPNEVTEKALLRHIRVYPALPFTAFRGLDEAQVARVQELMPPIPGLELTSRAARTYPFGAVGAHLTGFVGRRDPNTEERRDEYSYFLPEFAGRAGLERVYDECLRGRGGAQLVRVDCLGFFYRELPGAWTVAHGDDLVLTIDARAQRIAQMVLHGCRGAMVLVDPRSGAVLALVSEPTYDPGALTPAAYAALADDAERRPLVNRALAGGYMPGSIVKPLIALCALEAGTITPETEIECPGYHLVGNARIHCSHRYGHGPLTLVHALESSCNTFFIDVALKTGIDTLTPFLATAGIGRDLGFELKPGGSDGQLPSRQEKWLQRRQPWNAFDTALAAIGQGEFTLSPLQAAMFTAALANGGTLFRPYVVDAIKNPRGEFLQVTKHDTIATLPVSQRSLDVVREGMWRVVHGEHATAPAARTPAIELLGKTGTAEVGSGATRSKNTWFICYGPADAPRYALAVLVEDGISGGKSAAPLARRFFEFYLADRGDSAESGPDRP